MSYNEKVNMIAAKRAIYLLEKFGLDTSAADELSGDCSKKMSDITLKQVLGLKYMAAGELSDAEKARLTESGAAGMSAFMSYPSPERKAARECVTEGACVTL